VAGAGSAGIALFRGSATGTVAVAGTYVTPLTTISQARLGDLDGDGLDDLIGAGPPLFVARNSGTSFLAARPVSDCTGSIQVVDVDGDGDLDVAAACPDAAAIMLNDGAGNFTEHRLPVFGLVHQHLSDLDGDGLPDLNMVVRAPRPGGGPDMFWVASAGTRRVVP